MLNPKEIGFRIKQRREELGLTLEDIASSVKVARSTIQRYETGSISRPKLPVLYSISQALRVSPDWLLGIADDPTPSIPEKTAADDGDGLSPLEKRLMQLVHRLSDDQKEMLLAQIELLLSKLGWHPEWRPDQYEDFNSARSKEEKLMLLKMWGIPKDLSCYESDLYKDADVILADSSVASHKVLSKNESKLVDTYRSVTEQGQHEMLAHADYIAERYKKNPTASADKAM